MHDPFEHALRDEDELAEIYPPPERSATGKDIGRLDELSTRLVAASPMVMIASFAGDGGCDVTPRGGPPGFVSVLSERLLAIPDATGNRRLDSMRNIVQTARAGLLFLIPAGRRRCASTAAPASASIPSCWPP